MRTRRQILSGSLAAAAATLGFANSAMAQTAPVISVFKSASCGCCGAWVEHLKRARFAVSVRDLDDVAPIKRQHGVPAQLESCHTATLEGYVIEGHVPAADIRQLLTERPQIRGLAVPGMPIGSPGMETGASPERYEVIAWRADGSTSVFRRY
jgi:hypothetical protein